MNNRDTFRWINAQRLDIDGVEVTASAAELNVLDGITATVAELNALDGVTSTPAELDEVYLPLDIADLSADTTYYVVAPCDGDITLIYSVIDGAVATADVTITPSIGGTPITDGAITIATAGSAAGDVDSATPSAANSVSAGDVIALAVAGGGSGGSPRGHVVIVISR